jgi:hypothetical protein
MKISPWNYFESFGKFSASVFCEDFADGFVHVDDPLVVKTIIRRSLSGQWLGGRYGVITIRPSGGQPPAGPTAAPGLAALRTYLVFLVTINQWRYFVTMSAWRWLDLVHLGHDDPLRRVRTLRVDLGFLLRDFLHDDVGQRAGCLGGLQGEVEGEVGVDSTIRRTIWKAKIVNRQKQKVWNWLQGVLKKGTA